MIYALAHLTAHAPKATPAQRETGQRPLQEGDALGIFYDRPSSRIGCSRFANNSPTNPGDMTLRAVSHQYMRSSLQRVSKARMARGPGTPPLRHSSLAGSRAPHQTHGRCRRSRCDSGVRRDPALFTRVCRGRLYPHAETISLEQKVWSRTSFARKRWHDSRIQWVAFLPSLIHCSAVRLAVHPVAAQGHPAGVRVLRRQKTPPSTGGVFTLCCPSAVR